jgi:hypothetical protein
MIDFYRILTDPLTSYNRLMKTIIRIYKIQKHYPLPYITQKLYINENANINEIKNIIKIVYNEYIINKKSILLFGTYSYNYYLKLSKINKDYIKKLNLSCLEFISIDYIKDIKNIIDLLKKKLKDDYKYITITEYYPFFQFYDYNIIVSYKNTPFIYMFNNNNRCIPYKKVNALIFDTIDTFETDKYIYLSSFNTTIMMYLIYIIKENLNKNNNKEYYYTFVSHLFQLKRYYFEETRKTIISDTIFEEFIIECIGKFVQPERERYELIKLNNKTKNNLIWKYEPAKKYLENPPKYKLLNSTGNKIHNIKNLKISIK